MEDERASPGQPPSVPRVLLARLNPGMAYFNQLLGLEAGDDEGSIVLDTQPEHQVAPDVIHFAVLTTLAEVAAAQAVGAAVVPASVSIQLLARARPGRLVGRGRLLHRGRRLAVAEGDVRQDGRLVAKATVSFALLG
ncbi:MAG: PaaI family thioesterase [Thermoanaerobaculia bacterium]|nr:PaaI family thioesterase [Thermoanaerobaculia bacterium]